MSTPPSFALANSITIDAPVADTTVGDHLCASGTFEYGGSNPITIECEFQGTCFVVSRMQGGNWLCSIDSAQTGNGVTLTARLLESGNPIETAAVTGLTVESPGSTELCKNPDVTGNPPYPAAGTECA